MPFAKIPSEYDPCNKIFADLSLAPREQFQRTNLRNNKQGAWLKRLQQTAQT
jgi:hypothetical protein